MKLKYVSALCTLLPMSIGAHGPGDGAHEHEVKQGESTLKQKEELRITGNGEFSFETVPGWGVLTDGKPIGSTHGGVAIDRSGLVYVSTDGPQSICVFEKNGQFVKSIAPDCKGMHSLQLVEQEGKEYLFGAQLPAKRLVKMDLDGKVVLSIPIPEITGEVPGGWNGVTAAVAAPDGRIFAAMGYGSNLIHQFSKEGKLMKTFGGQGKEDGKFVCCHGMTLDFRFGEPRLLVVDRENRRLVHFDLEGKYLGTHASHLRRPCAAAIHGDHLAVAELEARVVVLDKNGQVVAFLGDNPKRQEWANYGVAPKDWKAEIFTAPHGLTWDDEGNLYVQDWNQTGRVRKLKRVK